MASVISGILAFPRLSRNGVFYWPQELAKFGGAEIPLRFNHIKTPEGIVGTAKLAFDEEKMQVTYIAKITNPEVQKLVDNHNFQVSLGAMVKNPGAKGEEICHPTDGTCFEAPILSRPTEMSIVETPGMPETTLNVVEGSTSGDILGSQTYTFQDNTIPSYVREDVHTWYMTTEDQHPDECPEGQHKVDDKCVPITDEAQHGCPPGFKDVDGKCVKEMTVIKNYNTSHISKEAKHLNMAEKPQDKTVEEKTKITIETDGVIVTPSAEIKSDDEETKKTETTKKEDCGCGHTHEEPQKAEVPAPIVAQPTAPVVTPTEDEIAKRIQTQVDQKVDSFLEKIKTEKWTPKSEVTESNLDGFVEEAFTDKDGKAVLDKLNDNGFASFTVDKEGWMKKNMLAQNNESGEVTEAVTTSGTIPGIKTTTNIIQLRGGKVFQPIRQFGQFQAIPTGQNTARFYTLDNPNYAAITEQLGTDITAGTHALASIDITCNVRGLRQTILQSELEDFPASFLGALRTQMRDEAVRDETNLVLTTIADTTNDFGVAGGPFHIGGDGVDTTDTTEEDADVNISKAGVARGRRLLEANGFSPLPGNFVLFLHPVAYEGLLLDTNISTLIEQGLPGKSTSGIIESYLGVQLIVTTALRTENNAFRNVLLNKGTAFALCSQRTLKIELAKTIERQTIDVVATHRIGVDELDKASYGIISTDIAG